MNAKVHCHPYPLKNQGTEAGYLKTRDGTTMSHGPVGKMNGKLRWGHKL